MVSKYWSVLILYLILFCFHSWYVVAVCLQYHMKHWLIMQVPKIGIPIPKISTKCCVGQFRLDSQDVRVSLQYLLQDVMPWVTSGNTFAFCQMAWICIAICPDWSIYVQQLVLIRIQTPPTWLLPYLTPWGFERLLLLVSLFLFVVFLRHLLLN